MKPFITFHNVASVALSDVRTMTARERLAIGGDGPAFSVRDLILTDAAGQTFRVGLFADTPEAIMLPGEGPPAGRVPDPNDDPAALATETVDA